MKSPALLDGLKSASALPKRPLHLAIGMFDGVHLGHQAVIETAVHSARRSDGLAAVLTFWPHPSRLFRRENPVRQLHSAQFKARLLLSLGVNAVITEPFTEEFGQLEALEFLLFLRSQLKQLTAIYVGENWRFGRGRNGDVDLLVTEARRWGLGVFSAPRVSHDGEPISSTRIRKLLEDGAIELASTLLGYTYFSEGTVTPGKRLGRTIGFPTLNIPWEPELLPRLGVYTVRVTSSKSPEPMNGVANFGLRPTVEATTQPRLEIHILGSCAVTEGDDVRVEWLRFLRPEQKFANLDALRAQITADREQAEAFFGEAQS